MRKPVAAALAAALFLGACVSGGTPVPCPDTTPPTAITFEYSEDVPGPPWTDAVGATLPGGGGEYTTSSRIYLRVTGDDADTGVQGANVVFGSTVLSPIEVIQGPPHEFIFIFNVNAQRAGSNALTARVYDGCANSLSSADVLTVDIGDLDGERPVVDPVTTDPASPIQMTGAVTVSAAVSSPMGYEFQSVRFLSSAGHNLLAAATFPAPGGTFSASWNVTLAHEGVVSWRARAVDEFGNTRDGADEPVTVDFTGIHWRQVGGDLPQRAFQLPGDGVHLERPSIAVHDGQPVVIYTADWTAGAPRLLQVRSWNGSIWQALGEPATGLVGALASDGTSLYRARLVSSPAINFYEILVERWSSGTWSGVGPGPNVFADPAAGANAVALLPPTGASDQGLVAVWVASNGVKASRFNGSTWSSPETEAIILLEAFGLVAPSADLALANRIALARLTLSISSWETVLAADSGAAKPRAVWRRLEPWTELPDGAVSVRRTSLFSFGEDLLAAHLDPLQASLEWRYRNRSESEWQDPGPENGLDPDQFPTGQLSGLGAAHAVTLVGSSASPVLVWIDNGAARARKSDGAGGWVEAGEGVIVSSGARLEPAIATDGATVYVALIVRESGEDRLKVFKF